MRPSHAVIHPFVLAAAIVAIAPTAGCEKIRQRVFAKEVAVQTGGAIDAGEDPLAVDDPTAGSMLTGTATIPSDFPKDVPFYPGAKPIVATTTREPETGEPKYTIVAQTSDTPEQVMSFYRSRFPKPEVESSFAGTHVMTLKTTGGIAASVTAAPTGGKTLVTLSAGRR